MLPNKGVYFNLISSEKKPSHQTIDQVISLMEEQKLKISTINTSIYKKNQSDEKITEELTRLSLRLVEGNKSWEGLFVGFPGTVSELSTKSVGTPYLRKILYPILDLHHRLQTQFGKHLPCIYFVGERFSDVFLRKFDLLKGVVPNIIVITHDIYQCVKNKSTPPRTKKTQRAEHWTQKKLSESMWSEKGLFIPTRKKKLTAKFLCTEVSCYEGTKYPERLDILGYDEDDGSLIAFELKGLVADRVELENLFLQGMEHRNWIEKNKMAVKLLFGRDPRGKKINTRKRVRLLLGYYGEKVPYIFNELRDDAESRDPYINIDFVKLSNENDEVQLNSFEE
jgi:hypothetical protein